MLDYYYVLEPDGTVRPAKDREEGSKQWGNHHRIVRQEYIGPAFVSTVFLVLDHQFGNGPPILFETMVFMGSYSDLDCRRYHTLEEAKEGHEAMKRKWRYKQWSYLFSHPSRLLSLLARLR